jgi:anti-sigma factor RsiW
VESAMNCRQVRPLLETFADGELAPAETLDVEAHLDECEPCATQLLFVQSVQASVRSVVQADAVVSADFSARLERAMLAAEDRTVVQATPEARQRWFSRRNLGPSLAAAAVMVAWIGWQRFGKLEATHEIGAGRAPVQLASASDGIEGALDRLIDYHSSPQEPQVTEANLLPTFEPNVGVKIRLPSLNGAHWDGASLVSVVNYQAASLAYSMPGHRVTVYVFDPRRVPVRQPLERVARRVTGEEPVYVGQWRGYSVAAKERRGVGYAMTGDLDDQEILQMISSIQ